MPGPPGSQRQSQPWDEVSGPGLLFQEPGSMSLVNGTAPPMLPPLQDQVQGGAPPVIWSTLHFATKETSEDFIKGPVDWEFLDFQ